MKSIQNETAEVKITRKPCSSFLGGRIPQMGYNTFIVVNAIELIELWSNNVELCVTPAVRMICLDKDYDGNIHSETFLRK